MVVLLAPAWGCEYPPYPDGEPTNYQECVEKNTRNFTSSEPAKAIFLTEKSCREKFPK